MVGKTFTWKEVKDSMPTGPVNSITVTKADECLIVIKNKVYNIAGEFNSWHPGGCVALTQIGLDATSAFGMGFV